MKLLGALGGGTKETVSLVRMSSFDLKQPHRLAHVHSPDPIYPLPSRTLTRNLMLHLDDQPLVLSALFPELLYLVYDDGCVPPDMVSDSGEDVPMPDPEADDTPEARRRAAWATVREMLEVKSEPHTSDYET